MTNIDWKYPKKDGWPPEEWGQYLVTVRWPQDGLHTDSVFPYWWTNAFSDRWRFIGLDDDDVIAWAEMPEPAKEQD